MHSACQAASGGPAWGGGDGVKAAVCWSYTHRLASAAVLNPLTDLNRCEVPFRKKPSTE